jgi:iron complex outermembrane receptor protein
MVADEILLWDGVFTLSPSARVDQAGHFTTSSPKLGAALSLPSAFVVRANAGQAHRAPSFLELYVMQGNLLPNPLLRPERALYVDLGVARETEHTSFAITGFHSLYEDLISYEYFPGSLAKPENFNAALVQGIELEARARPNEHLSGELAYTLTNSANLRAEPSLFLKPLPYRPRHRLVGRVNGGFQRLRARAEADYQSEQTTNRTGTGKLPERTFVNLGVTARVWDQASMSASFDVKNVLDVQTADFDGYPLPGRAAYLTLSFAFEETKT